MVKSLRFCVLALCLAGSHLSAPRLFAQGPVPLADTVETTLTPSGISELPITLDGSMVYLFSEDDGTDVAHFLGGFSLQQGEIEHNLLESKEAVVWISHAVHDGIEYQHLDILLWRDAQIIEPGGTMTTGPALLVTLNSVGTLTLGADALAYESSAEREVYKTGKTIRNALTRADVLVSDPDSSLRVLDTTGLSLQSKKPKIKPPVLFQSSGGIGNPQSW